MGLLSHLVSHLEIEIGEKQQRIQELESAIEDIHKIIVGEEGKIEAVWEVFDKFQQLCEKALTGLGEGE